MITQQETADYINANINSTLTANERDLLKAKITPAQAIVLIKLLGDVSILVHIRDKAGN
jgi:hypothetical protein